MVHMTARNILPGMILLYHTNFIFKIAHTVITEVNFRYLWAYFNLSDWNIKTVIKSYLFSKPNHGLLVKPSAVTIRGINAAELIKDWSSIYYSRSILFELTSKLPGSLNFIAKICWFDIYKPIFSPSHVVYIDIINSLPTDLQNSKGHT